MTCLFSTVKYYIYQIILILEKKKKRKIISKHSKQRSQYFHLSTTKEKVIFSRFLFYILFPFLRFTDKT